MLVEVVVEVTLTADPGADLILILHTQDLVVDRTATADPEVARIPTHLIHRGRGPGPGPGRGRLQ